MHNYLLHPVLNDFAGLDDLATKVVMDSRIGDRDSWFLLFRQGLRAVLARWELVTHHYHSLHEWDGQRRDIEAARHVYEVQVAPILFGMASALECYIFTLNSLGYSVTPEEFHNITDAEELEEVGVDNILGTTSLTGWQSKFPNCLNYWQQNKELIQAIMEQAEVSRRRKSSVRGWTYRTDAPAGYFENIQKQLGRALSQEEKDEYSPPTDIRLTASPKLPGSQAASTTYTVETLTEEFHRFIYELMKITVSDTYNNIVIKLL